MALTSTLGSPGIEIREVDNSYRLDSSTATTIYIPGFAAQGPVEEVMSISSISDFETIYGTPTNAAERYFYYTVKAILDGAGTGTTVLCSRLPYGSGQGDTVTNAYTLLAYPAIPVIKKEYILSNTVSVHQETTETLEDGSVKTTYSFDNHSVEILTTSTATSLTKNITILRGEEDVTSETIEISQEDFKKNEQLLSKYGFEFTQTSEDDEEEIEGTIKSYSFIEKNNSLFQVTCETVTDETNKEVKKYKVETVEKVFTQPTNSSSLDPVITTFDYDQYIIGGVKQVTLQGKSNKILALSKNDEKAAIDNLFTIKHKTLSETAAPNSYSYSFVIDGDKDGDKSKSFSITNLKVNEVKDLPQISSIINLADTSSTEKIAAPKLTFLLDGKETYATGLVATQLINDTDYKVHMSYTVYGNKVSVGIDDTKETHEKIGSLYINLIYKKAQPNTASSDETIDDTINNYEFQVTTTGVSAEKIVAFEIAKSYQGQSTDDLGGWDPYAGAWDKTTFVNEKTSDFSSDVTYLIGSPVTFQISLNEYYKIVTGEALKWSRRPYTFNQPLLNADNSEITNSNKVYEYTGDETGSASLFGLYEAIGHSAFIVINTSRSIINNNFEGYYIGLTDNMFVNPSDDYTYDAVDSVKITTKFFDKTSDILGLMDNSMSLGDFQTLSNNRLSFYLNSNYQGSISRILTRNITSMDVSGTEFDDTISMGLFKLSKSATSSDILKLNYSLREKYNWSFGKTRVKSSASSTIPVSYFAENVMENSSNMSILINPYISNKAYVDTDGVIHGKMRVYGNKLVENLDKFETKYLLRNYTNVLADTKENGAIASNSQKISAIVPAKVAQSSIESWKSIVKQAGITPELIKDTLGYGEDLDETSEYYSFQPLNSILPFGTYTSATNTNKIIGSLPIKLQRALELVENDEEYPDIDIVLESGLGTIYVNSSDNEISSESAYDTLIIDEENNVPVSGEANSRSNVFDENIILTGIEDLRTGRSSLSDEAQKVIEDYRAIQDVFTNFANSMQNGGRGDTFYISDVPRGILIKGKNTKVTNLYGTQIENNAYDFGETVNHSFPTSVYYPIKHTFDTIVSSYMSTYAQWVKVLDNFSGEKVWIPVSGYIAANMASTDTVYGPWYAAAGLRRGVINGTLDYALSPNVSQRTDLYKLCINSVPKIPNYGVTIWGIRTMSKAASAFDQNTCRRTFLYMEKKVKQTLRYYIFEPNTSYTRLQIVNDIDPFLEKVKNAGGIYNYTLICDTTNNTPDVINNGDLAVSIAAAPTRTAENIVVEFTANKYTEEVSASESM